MPAPVHATLVLTGIFANKTVNLNGLQFEHGEHVVTGSADDVEGVSRYLARSYQAYPKGSDQLKAMQARFAEANKEGSDGEHNSEGSDNPSESEQSPDSDLQPAREGTEAQASDAGAESASTPEGEAGDVPSGDGHQDSGLSEKPGTTAPRGAGSPNPGLTAAVKKLDPQNDEHWTQQGLPILTAVEQAYGETGVTRTDVSNAAPDWTRDTAALAAVEAPTEE